MGIKAPAQFVFDRGYLFKGNLSPGSADSNSGILSFVSSYATLTNEQISSLVMEQARQELGLTKLEHLGTINERRATFCCKPGLVRPGPQISDQLWACGDYVAGPYPSTLEGAVLSGVAVIQKVMGSC